jgi:hypothetical protein
MAHEEHDMMRPIYVGKIHANLAATTPMAGPVMLGGAMPVQTDAVAALAAAPTAGDPVPLWALLPDAPLAPAAGGVTAVTIMIPAGGGSVTAVTTEAATQAALLSPEGPPTRAAEAEQATDELFALLGQLPVDDALEGPGW